MPEEKPLKFHFGSLFKKLMKKNLRRSSNFYNLNTCLDENKSVLFCPSIKRSSSFQWPRNNDCNNENMMCMNSNTEYSQANKIENYTETHLLSMHTYGLKGTFSPE